MGCSRCGYTTPSTGDESAAAESYEAQRRCTATGYCNDDEIGAHGAGEAQSDSNTALCSSGSAGLAAAGSRSTMTDASGCQPGTRHERRRDGHQVTVHDAVQTGRHHHGTGDLRAGAMDDVFDPTLGGGGLNLM